MIQVLIVWLPVILLVVLALLHMDVFTLVGFAQTESRSGLTKMTALADQHVTVSGDDITVPVLNKILGVAFCDPDGIAAQLQSPSLRRLFQPNILPLYTALYFDHTMPPYHDFSENPIELEASEKINALLDNDGNAEYGLCLLWLTDGSPIPAGGQIRTLKFTMTGGSAAYAWTNQALTPTQTLPAGKYMVVGMHSRPASVDQLLAVRLSFVGGTWRPGIIGGVSAIDQRPALFRNGRLGNWGEFEFDQPPTVDYLARGATGTIQIFLDLIQIRSGR